MFSTVPNVLTFVRLALLLPICLLIGWNNAITITLALILYLIAAATDYADGWWARAYNAGSEFGRMMDPIADKIYIAGLFIVLVAVDRITGLWLLCPILILGREFLIAGVREFLGPRGIVVNVSPLAKWKTTTQMVSLGFLIIPVAPFHQIGLLILLIATVLTLVTATQYLKVIR